MLWHQPVMMFDASHENDRYSRTKVAEKLKQEAVTTRQSFNQVVNSALKRGLALEAPLKRRTFRVKAISSAYAPGFDPLHLNRLTDAWIETHVQAK